MRESFVLYTEYRTHLDMLTMEQRGVLLTAIMNYAAGAELPDFDGMTRMAFSFIRSKMDEDAEKYEKVCQARKEAGSKGGRPKANGFDEKAKKPNGYFENQSKAKKPDNDNEYDNDSILSTDKSVDSIRRRIMDFWNAELTPLGITPIRAITENTKRHQMLKSRIRQYGLDEVLSTISMVKESEFLIKEGSSWFNFDWFIKPENFQKVHDGNYRSIPQKTAAKSKKPNGFDLMTPRNFDWDAFCHAADMGVME